MAKERERFQQSNESNLGSLHHLRLSKKCQRKVESRAVIHDCTLATKIEGDWDGPRDMWRGQTTPKKANKKSYFRD